MLRRNRFIKAYQNVFIKFEVKIPQDHDSSKHAGQPDVDGAPRSSAEADPSHLHFSAVASSHCFEEFWLDDRDCKPEEDESNTVIKALQCFRDTLSAESELNLSIFSKSQRQRNHIDILDRPVCQHDFVVADSWKK